MPSEKDQAAGFVQSSTLLLMFFLVLTKPGHGWRKHQQTAERSRWLRCNLRWPDLASLGPQVRCRDHCKANLAHHISLLRKTLDVGANGSKYIQTVPRRGYRFVANVRCLRGESTDVSSQERPGSGEIKEKQIRQNGNATTARTRTTALHKHPKRALVLTLTVFIVAVAVTAYL